MSQSDTFSVVIDGKTVTMPISMQQAFFDRLIAAGASQESSESSVPQESSEAGKIKWPSGYSEAGVSTEALDRDGRHYPKGSAAASKRHSDKSLRWVVGNEAGCSKIAAKLVRVNPDTSGSKPPQTGYTSFTGQLVIAGTTLKCRVTEGQLRHGGEATNIHFADDLRKVENSADVRKRLSSKGWRFSYTLTKNTADSASSWYINSVFTIAQIQEMLS